MRPNVTISIVNFNHLKHLPACLEAVRDQTAQASEVIVTDNASTDGSTSWLQENASDCRIVLNDRNLGYAAGHNAAFRMATTPYVLALNCDVVLDERFVEHVTSTLDAAPKAGSACGRLQRGCKGDTSSLDSTGLFPDRLRRFHDRDHDAVDAGQRRLPAPIFGPSGSAALFRRSMLEDVAFEGQYFDEDFFAYYEDADLAWRAQRRGWTSIFVPDAIGWHVHEDMSRARSRRRDPDANFRQMLLTRNRHLCFLKNDRFEEMARDLPFLLAYDLALEVYLLTRKPGLAVRWPREVARALIRTGRKRADTFKRSRRTVRLSDWFDLDHPPHGL